MILSGEIHYPRVPRGLWEDRLIKLKGAGFNTVTAYFFWNYHEIEPGVYDFSGEKDVDAFLSAVDSLGLKLIARVGPYVCAEWDNGGHPDWLISDKLIPRSLDPSYYPYAEKWLRTILAKLAKYDKSRGGNLIALQLENEYFWGDIPYHEALAKLARELGITVPLYTNANRYARNTNYVDTLDLYPNPWDLSSVIKSIKEVQQTQPSVAPEIMEFEGGWFSTLAKPLPTERGSIAANWTRMFFAVALAYGVDLVSFYMFHGGTNFGPWAARSMTTSYDYEAMVREWGELGERYYKVRTLSKLADLLEGTDLISESLEGDRLKIVRSRDGTDFVFRVNNDVNEWKDGATRVPPKDVRVSVNGLKVGSSRVSCNLDLLGVYGNYVIFFGDYGEEYRVDVEGGVIESGLNCQVDGASVKGTVTEMSGFKVNTPEGIKILLIIERSFAERTWSSEFPIISNGYFLEGGDKSGLVIQASQGKTTLYVPFKVGEYLNEVNLGKVEIDVDVLPPIIRVIEILKGKLAEKVIGTYENPPALEDIGLYGHEIYVYGFDLPRGSMGIIANDFGILRGQEESSHGFAFVEGKCDGQTKLYVASTGHPNGPDWSFIPYKTGIGSPALIDKKETGRVIDWDYGWIDLGHRYQPGIATYNSQSMVINKDLGSRVPTSWSKVRPRLTSQLLLLYSRGKFTTGGGPGIISIKGLSAPSVVLVNGELAYKGRGNDSQDTFIYSKLKQGENEVIVAAPIYGVNGEIKPPFSDVTYGTWQEEVNRCSVSSLYEKEMVKAESPITINEPSVVAFKFEFKRQSDISQIFARISGNFMCQIYLNGFFIGRYYPRTSQERFYLPEPYLKEGLNELKLRVIPSETGAVLKLDFGTFFVARRIALGLK